MISRAVLKEQVYSVISQCVGDSDIVIGALRYGAHLPHIYQNVCQENQQSPRRIKLILSHMLKFFPAEFFREGRFVILDDTIYEGVEMNNLLTILTTELGVPRERVRTAALVVHGQSDHLPDCPKPPVRLPDPEYIAWKEELAALVRQDIRPTERDHPLYYFKADNLELGDFLSALEPYGHLHPVGKDWNAPVFRASLTINSSALDDIKSLEGIEIDEIFKVRIYWQQLENGGRLTAVPMCFPKIDIPIFVERGSQYLAKAIGLRDSFFKELYDTHPEGSREGMAFYFASRSIAALLLQRLFAQITPTIQQLKARLHTTCPEQIDGYVDYMFPKEYLEFYDSVFRDLNSIVSAELTYDNLPLRDVWKKPERVAPRVSNDPILPEIYQVIAFMTRNADPARWDGIRWSPQKDAYQGVTYKEFLQQFSDPVFVSAALDELLDSGLMRAKDVPLDNSHTCFSRVFLSGGEYNAVQVSRIADTWRCQVSEVDPELTQEEALELWGTY